MIGATMRSWSWAALGAIATGIAYVEQGISLGIAAGLGLGAAAVTAGVGLTAGLATGAIGLAFAIPAGLLSLIVLNGAPLQVVGEATMYIEKAILNATITAEKAIYNTTANVVIPQINKFFKEHIKSNNEVYKQSSKQALEVGKEQEEAARTIQQEAAQKKQAVIEAAKQKYAAQEQQHQATMAQLDAAFHSTSGAAQSAAQQSAAHEAAATTAVGAAEQNEQRANAAYKKLDKAIEKAETVPQQKTEINPKKMAAAKAKMQELKAQGVRVANVDANGADVVIGEKAQPNPWRRSSQEPSAEAHDQLAKETHASPGVGAY